MTPCTNPVMPRGWRCTREAGHTGPCAGVHKSMEPKVEQRYRHRRHGGEVVLIAQALYQKHGAENQRAIVYGTPSGEVLVSPADEFNTAYEAL